MALHPQKTKFLVFNASEQMLLDQNFRIFIDNNNENENFEHLKLSIERITSNSDPPAIKFLGVYLDPKLNFKFHLSQIANKISRALYVIQTAKNILTDLALKSLYYAMLHTGSHLIYGIHIWSSAATSTLNALEKLQTKAIRIISRANYNSHTEPLFKTLGILPLKMLANYFKILFMYDYINVQLPVSFNNLWLTNAEQREVENTVNPRVLRDDNLLYVPYVRLEHYKNFPLDEYPRIWNEFNHSVASNSRNSFKYLLKNEYFLSKLSNVVNCNRMLCPTCHLQPVT
jgi:hypothetical protein